MNLETTQNRNPESHVTVIQGAQPWRFVCLCHILKFSSFTVVGISVSGSTNLILETLKLHTLPIAVAMGEGSWDYPRAAALASEFKVTRVTRP